MASKRAFAGSAPVEVVFTNFHGQAVTEDRGSSFRRCWRRSLRPADALRRAEALSAQRRLSSWSGLASERLRPPSSPPATKRPGETPLMLRQLLRAIESENLSPTVDPAALPQTGQLEGVIDTQSGKAVRSANACKSFARSGRERVPRATFT